MLNGGIRVKNKIKNFLMIFIVLIACFMGVSNADVGNFESYDSDWGSDSSWDSDWGSDWDSDWDSDYDYDSTYYGGEDVPFAAIVFMIIVFIIIGSYINKHSIELEKRLSRRRYTNRTVNYTSSNSINSSAVLAKIKQTDKFFNEANFLSWAKNLFVKLQNAWTDRNFETIRTFETTELFEQHSNQIKRYIENKQINVMDRIAVNYAKLYSFEQDNDKDTLSIVLNSSMLDYIIDEETKNVIQGNKTTRRTNTYLMTFIRKKGIVTAESTDELKTTNCPNCGAPTHITSSGKCEYCASVITTGEHNWILSNLEPFRG